MAHRHSITVSKTARYFTLGTLSPLTKEVWIVLHGYAQLAEPFLKQFESLANEYRFFVAPEGLNRFYAKGFGGQPAATWMTSEDREAEIADYLNYLESLYKQLDIPSGCKVKLLGFSQGVATASRFLHHTNQPIHEFLICSGEIAQELTNPILPKWLNTKTTYFTGNRDPFITPEKQVAVFELMKNLNAKVVLFDGAHEVKPNLLV